MADPQARRRGRPPAIGRRDELVAAAAPLFRRRGFANVRLGDVAAELGLGASAVYRHVSGKDELLDAAISSGLDLVEQRLAAPGGEDAVVAVERLAEAALERPDLWILLRREALNLDPDRRREHVDRFAILVRTLGQAVAARRPDLTVREVELTSRAALACLAAPSQYPAPEASGHRSPAGLSAAALRLLDVDLAAGTELPPAEVALPFRPDLARREAVLEAATEEFAHHGYAAASLADVARRSGVSTATLYHYVDGKGELLTRVLDRAAEWIDADRSRVLRSGASPVEALEALAIAYVDLALSQTRLFRIFVNDVVHLEPEALATIAATHLRYVQAWSALVEAALGVTEDESWNRVTAALCVVNELALSSRWRRDPAIRSSLVVLVRCALGLPGSTSPGRAP